MIYNTLITVCIAFVKCPDVFSHKVTLVIHIEDYSNFSLPILIVFHFFIFHVRVSMILLLYLRGHLAFFSLPLAVALYSWAILSVPEY
jgi:hypothetical protein